MPMGMPVCKGCVWYMLLPIISWDAFHNYLSARTLEAAGATEWNSEGIGRNKPLWFSDVIYVYIIFVILSLFNWELHLFIMYNLMVLFILDKLYMGPGQLYHDLQNLLHDLNVLGQISQLISNLKGNYQVINKAGFIFQVCSCKVV